MENMSPRMSRGGGCARDSPLKELTSLQAEAVSPIQRLMTLIIYLKLFTDMRTDFTRPLDVPVSARIVIVNKLRIV
jgi:hypothetical protein